MPEPGRNVLMWEETIDGGRWSVGDWDPRFQQWSNRDDPEYAIPPHRVTHWIPLPEDPSL